MDRETFWNECEVHVVDKVIHFRNVVSIFFLP